MDKENVYNTVNFNGLPITGQNYSIPDAFSTNGTYHDRAMYSLWENFIEMCANSNNNIKNNGTMNFKQALFTSNEVRSPLQPIDINSNYSRVVKIKSEYFGNPKKSRYLPNRERLPIFIDLSSRNE